VVMVLSELELVTSSETNALTTEIPRSIKRKLSWEIRNHLKTNFARHQTLTETRSQSEFFVTDVKFKNIFLNCQHISNVLERLTTPRHENDLKYMYSGNTILTIYMDFKNRYNNIPRIYIIHMISK
jgi:hypothetical protein